MGNNLIEISKKLFENIKEIDSVLDNYFDPIKDLTDTAGDIFSPIKAVHSLYVLNKKRKFKNFLMSYAKSLDDGNSLDTKKIARLKDFLKDEKNFNFINETIENAINAKSIYGSILLGYFTGRVLSQEQRINFKDIIIIAGIKELNDYELSCFARMYSTVNLAKEINIRDYKALKSVNFFCELTITKLIQLRIVNPPKNTYDPNTEGRFLSNEIAEDIHELIQDAGIENELLNFAF